MFSLIVSLLTVLATARLDKPESATTDSDKDAFYYYKSRPDIEAPRWAVEVYDQSLLQEKGYYWFVSPYKHLLQREYPMWNGPHIYRTDGDLIWAGASFGNYKNAHDFRVDHIEGKLVLRMIYPKLEFDRHGFVLDDTYSVHQAVNTRSEISGPNMHEFNLVDDGKHALIVTGPNATATDINDKDYTGPCKIGWQGFAEVDVSTNQVLFEWSARDHVTFHETTFVQEKGGDTLAEKCANNWDIMHINSVDKFANGDYLISARHANTLYRISHVDHSIVWRLGGMRTDFQAFSELASFSRQHHSRIRSENDTHVLISLFNNAVGDQDKEEASAEHSSGLLLVLHTARKPMRVEMVHQYVKPLWPEMAANNSLVVSRGSMDVLPNSNVFMNWVNSSHLSEHSADGRLLMQAVMLKQGANSYRSFKMRWTGRPANPPDVFVEGGEDEHGKPLNVVYVSWNGATEVATWNVLDCNSSRVIASATRETFETKILLGTNEQRIVAVALDAESTELGRSQPVDVPLVKRPGSSPSALQPSVDREVVDGTERLDLSAWSFSYQRELLFGIMDRLTYYCLLAIGFLVGFYTHHYYGPRRIPTWRLAIR